MSFEHWREAVRHMRSRTQPATDAQRELARSIGVDIPKRLPALVAGARLKTGMGDTLFTLPPGEMSFGQGEFLSALADDLRIDCPRPRDANEASAWIEVLLLRREIEALRRLQLRRGDVVRDPRAREKEIEGVSSIGEDGRVFFVGGGGKRLWASKLIKVADEGSAEAAALRPALANIVARRRASAAAEANHASQLAKYKSESVVSRHDADRLERVIDEASNERPLQRFLTESPHILASLVRGNRGTFVLPLPRLGAAYIPDFAIAAIDSAGIHWTLVELESPTAEPSMANGLASKALRQAIAQLEEWREWLGENLGQAQRPVEAHGLGLAGIRQNPDGLILIGTANERPLWFTRTRARLREERRIQVHTYSWLVRTLRQPAHPIFAPLDATADLL